MKINTDVLPANVIKKEGRPQDQKKDAGRAERRVDKVTITADKKGLVAEENKSAAKTGFKDIKKVEEAVGKLKGILTRDPVAAADIHQLGEKNIVTISRESK